MTTEETAIVRSFLDDDYAIPDDLPGVQTEPGRLQWQHGEIAAGGKIKTPGVFFGRDTAFGNPPPPPWETDDRFAQTSGSGFSAAILRMAFIGERSQWFIPGETDDDPVVWLPNGTMAPEGTKVKKNIEYLVLIDGLDEPMVLSVSGYYKSKPIENILYDYTKRGALAQLIRAKKRMFPRWSHWLTIGGRTDDKGQPIIEKATDATGKEYNSPVTPPALLAAPELVSKATFEQAIDTWNFYSSVGWFKAQRLPRGVTDAPAFTVSSVPALPAGRNVPQPVDEVEF